MIFGRIFSYGVVPIIRVAIQSEEMSFDPEPGKVQGMCKIHDRRGRIVDLDAFGAGRVLTVAKRFQKNPQKGTFCDATRQMF